MSYLPARTATCWKLLWREYSKADANEVNTVGSCKTMNQGGTNWCDGHDARWFFFLLTVVPFPDGIRKEFLRQLRLPAAHSLLERQKEEEKRGAIIQRWRHGKMKGAFSWNPGCSTISIFIKTSHPLWCGTIACVRERVYPWCRQNAKGRKTGGGLDKQSESEGVAPALTNWVWWMSLAVRND